jgi:hypothetical protein
MIFIRVGTLDDGGEGEIVPDVHIYASSKVDWVEIPYTVPVYGEFYPGPDAVWRQESLDRFEKVKDKMARKRSGFDFNMKL